MDKKKIEDHAFLFSFAKGSKYRGMERGKHYTL